MAGRFIGRAASFVAAISTFVLASACVPPAGNRSFIYTPPDPDRTPRTGLGTGSQRQGIFRESSY